MFNSKTFLKSVGAFYYAPALFFSAFTTQASTLDWDLHDGGANGWNPTDTSATILVDTVTLNMSLTGNLDFFESSPGPEPRVISQSGDFSYAPVSNDKVLDLDIDWGATSDQINYTVNFSEALSDFAFGVVDIDTRFRSGGTGNYYVGYRDQVTVRGFGLSGDVFATITLDPLAPANYVTVGGVNNNIVTGSQTAYTINNSLNDPLTTFAFNEDITGFEMLYNNAAFDRVQLQNDGYETDDPFNDPVIADPARQLIRIHDFTWETVPEPSSLLLLGFASLGFLRRNRTEK